MNIQLVYGRNSSGKSTHLYSRAIRRAKESKQTIVLVPEQYTLETERAIIAQKKGGSGLLNIQVMSITRLISWIFENVKNPDISVLDDVGKSLIIKSILINHADELKFYSGVSKTPGFCGYMIDLINDLSSFNVSAEDLSKALTNELSPDFNDKISDVLTVLQEYQKYNTDNKLLDSNDLVDLVCQLIDEKSDEIVKYFKDKLIIFDSFDYYPPKNIQLITSIAQITDGVCVAVTADKHRTEEIYTAGINSIDNIETMAKALNIDVEYTYCDYSADIPNKGIAHIKENLFTYPAKPLTTTCNVKIIKASGINEEVESTAGMIVDLLANEDYLLNEISIICSSLETYKPYFTRIFRQYELPVFIDVRRSVFSHPAVVFLLSALNFADNYIRNYAIDLIKTQYLPISADDIEVFEDYCIDNNIQGRMFTSKFNRGAKKYDLDRLNKIRQIIYNSALDIDTSKKTSKLWAKEILSFITKTNLKATLLDESQRLIDKGMVDSAAETAQAWNVILNVCEQLHNISNENILDLSEFIQLIEESFANIQIGVLPPDVNSITIGDIGRSKYTNTKAAFILGANEGHLPPPLPHGAILGDDELKALKEMRIIAGRDRDFRKKENSYSLYTALTSASHRLYLSYDGANGKQPALIIKKVRNLLSNIYIDSAHINPMAHPAAALSVTAKALGAIGDKRPVADGTWKMALSALTNDEQYERIIDKMYNFAAGNDGYSQNMVDHSKRMVTSVSQLEEYARCPFAYMISYGLSPADDPTSEIEYTASGAFLHKLMEGFGKELDSIDVDTTTDKELDIIIQKKAKHLAAVFDDGIFTADAKSEFLVQQLTQTALRAGNVYVKNLRRSDFVPIAHELVFDMGREYGPVAIDLPDGNKALLNGKIDRVDEFTIGEQKWLRAIDYKSGRKSIDLSGLITGENIQLFTYMNALKKSTGKMSAGVFYFPLRNDYSTEKKDAASLEKMEGWFVDNSDVIGALDTSINAGEKSEIVNLSYTANKTPSKRNASIKSNAYFDAALQMAQDTASNICENIYSGKMSPCPIVDSNSSSCQYCTYNKICRHGAQTFDIKPKPSTQSADAKIKELITDDSKE